MASRYGTDSSRPRNDDRRDRRRDDRRDRYDDRRDRDSYAPSRRRSRSPPRRSDRDRRDRDRYDDRSRRDFDRERSYDDRDREDRRRDDRHGDRDRRRRSSSATSAKDLKRGADGKPDDRHADKSKKDEKQQPADTETKEMRDKKNRLARLEEWKQKQLQKQAKQQADTPGPGLSPAITAPPTPAAPQTPLIHETNQSNLEPVKVNESQASSAETPPTAAPTNEPVGNIASFGLKAKPKTEVKYRNNILLDDEADSTKPKLQTLPDLGPDASADTPAIVDDEDVSMVDAGKEEEEEEIDPLDAFLNTLEVVPSKKAPPGETMFGDEMDLDAPQSAAMEDPLPNPVRKKKKEIPQVNHAAQNYLPFRKAFFNAPEEIQQLTPEEVADLRLELDGIKVKPDDAPRPVVKFAQMGLLQSTMDALQLSGFTKPTPIQSQAIPTVLSGRDVRGVAKTGSGKTLAFGLPSIRHILDQPPLKSMDGPIGLILAPTRELVVQIQNDIRPFFKASGLKISCVYGGSSIADNIATLKKSQTHVLVATPGRLIDLMQSNSGRVLNFKRVTYVVLDEADRMFDMGFEPQIMKVLANIRPDRQTLLFSATFPKSLDSNARKMLKNPVEITVGGRSTIPSQIKQIVHIVPPSPTEKFKQLLLHLGNLFSDPEQDGARAIVFCERQETCEDLLAKLLKKSWACDSIHGAKEQSDRDDAIRDFKSGALSLLIATSIAARGLDVEALALVINYDSPSHIEDLVHRIGRTGRAGRSGTGITLLERPGQERYAVFLAKAMRDSGQEVPEELQEMADVFTGKVKAGTEKWYGGSGFGGKGLDKLDQARAMDKRREKRALKGEYGDDSDSEPEAVDIPSIIKNVAAAPAAADAATPTPTAGKEEEEPAWMSILKGGIVVNKTERPAVDNSNLSHADRARAAAAAINARLGQKGRIHHGQPIDNKGPDSGAFHSTLEINDFPQKARWAVTNRTNISKVLESTGTSITTKGNFYAAGKTPGENDQPKLYILVEGDTEQVVLAAMTELTRLLREGTIAAQDEGSMRAPTGRYNVV